MFQVLLPTHEPHILPTVLMLAKALEEQQVPLVRSCLHWRPARAFARLIGGLNIRRLPGASRSAPAFCQLNHAWKNAFYPYVLRHPLVAYSFDCWPRIYDKWQGVFKVNKPRIAFVSARKSVTEMKHRVRGVSFRWLPEAGEPAYYNPTVPLVGRSVDVLEIGRSYLN